MPKGYLISILNVHDMDGFGLYVKTVAPMLQARGAQMLVNAPTTPQNIREMANASIPKGSNMVVIEFPSLEDATDFYESPEYQKAIQLRTPASDATFLLLPGML